MRLCECNPSLTGTASGLATRRHLMLSLSDWHDSLVRRVRLRHLRQRQAHAGGKATQSSQYNRTVACVTSKGPMQRAAGTTVQRSQGYEIVAWKRACMASGGAMRSSPFLRPSRKPSAFSKGMALSTSAVHR